MRCLKFWLALMLCACGASAQLVPTIPVTWSFQNYVGTNAGISRVTVQPLPPYPIVNGVYAVPETITFIPQTSPSLASGFANTNIQAGTLLQVTFSGPFGKLVKTNYFPFQLTNGSGPYNGGTYDVAAYQVFNNILVGVYFTGTNFLPFGGGATNASLVNGTSGAVTLQGPGIQTNGGGVFTISGGGSSSYEPANFTTNASTQITLTNGPGSQLAKLGLNDTNYATATTNGLGTAAFTPLTQYQATNQNLTALQTTNASTLGNTSFTNGSTATAGGHTNTALGFFGIYTVTPNVVGFTDGSGIGMTWNGNGNVTFGGTLNGGSAPGAIAGNGSALTGFDLVGSASYQAIGRDITNATTPSTNIPGEIYSFNPTAGQPTGGYTNTYITNQGGSLGLSIIPGQSNFSGVSIFSPTNPGSAFQVVQTTNNGTQLTNTYVRVDSMTGFVGISSNLGVPNIVISNGATFNGTNSITNNLPTGSTTQFGVYKVDGSTVTVNGSGVISSTGGVGWNGSIATGITNTSVAAGITNAGSETNGGLLIQYGASTFVSAITVNSGATINGKLVATAGFTNSATLTNTGIAAFVTNTYVAQTNFMNNAVLSNAPTTAAVSMLGLDGNDNLVANALPSGSGTVTSAGINADAGGIFSGFTGSPITSSGNMTPVFANQNANTIFAGPSSGGAAVPVFQTIPTFNGTNIQGVVVTNGAQSGYEPVFTPGVGPNSISWYPATNVDIPTTVVFSNIPPLTFYTNTSGSAQIYSVTVSNVVTGIAGNSSFTFSISNANSGGWSNQPIQIATSGATSAQTNYVDATILLSPNAVLAMTNTSTGAGDSAGQEPNTGQIMTIGNATAGGVASLGGNNTFSGNNTFTQSITGNGGGLTNLQGNQIAGPIVNNGSGWQLINSGYSNYAGYFNPLELTMCFSNQFYGGGSNYYAYTNDFLSTHNGHAQFYFTYRYYCPTNGAMSGWTIKSVGYGQTNFPTGVAPPFIDSGGVTIGTGIATGNTALAFSPTATSAGKIYFSMAAPTSSTNVIVNLTMTVNEFQ